MNRIYWLDGLRGRFERSDDLGYFLFWWTRSVMAHVPAPYDLQKDGASPLLVSVRSVALAAGFTPFSIRRSASGELDERGRIQARALAPADDPRTPANGAVR